jgi:hypothetical protein
MNPLTILYIGNARAFWCTEVHVAASLEELGHEVIFLQEDENTAEDVSRLAGLIRPSLLLWTRTWGLKGDALAMLKNLPCPSVAFHLDLYAGLKRDGGINTEPWWKCKYVFSADGGSDAFWKEKDVNHFYSPPGVYGKECYLAEPNPEWAADLCFTGSAQYHPEWPYRVELINRLREHYGPRFKLVEHNSPGQPWRGDKLNRLYASCKVGVGDTLCLGFNHANYFSDRLFEQAGRGIAQVFPYIRGIEDQFEIGKEILVYAYGDFDELFSKIDWLIEHDKERERMRDAALRRVLKEHTYCHRLEKVLQTIAEKEGWR